MSDDTTHFGYEQISKDEKAARVAQVFHSVASQYDLMNDLMSFGIHRLWKRYTIEMSGVRRGQRVLDIAGGTGDLAARFAHIVGTEGQIALTDINPSMLTTGRNRLTDCGIVGNITYTRADAECLPFPDHCFDCITIAFGLRNVTDKEKALTAMYRVLKPGGRLLVLEFSKPLNPLFAKLYDRYSFTILPLLGKVVTGDRQSYQYLAESIRMHPDQKTLEGMMAASGFERCEHYNLSGGVVALHRGFRL